MYGRTELPKIMGFVDGSSFVSRLMSICSLAKVRCLVLSTYPDQKPTLIKSESGGAVIYVVLLIVESIIELAPRRIQYIALRDTDNRLENFSGGQP